MNRPPWTSRGVLAAATVGTCAALALGGYDELGLDTPLAPAFAQAPGQMAAIVLRVGLLLTFAVAPARGRDEERVARTWILASVGALFLLSLVARGALALFVVAALGGLARIDRRETAKRVTPTGWLVLGACLALLGLATAKPRSADPTEGDARALASAWRSRGNLWRARWYALAWASTETPPGEAYVALAEANWDLGRRDKARHVLAKVLGGDPPDAIRRHAEAVLQLWNR